ncbi:MAG: carboxypeptidase regulatory-like domain-containing protein [Planctomycetes bacterium]|nr:carboxypeptidase regulatory-like domain-containing protein [Planctomycetota bacterium]
MAFEKGSGFAARRPGGRAAELHARMSHALPKPVLPLFVAVAGALALLIGLVRSSGRESSRPRDVHPIEEAAAGEEPSSLRVAIAPTPSEAKPFPDHPEAAPASVPAARHELARLSGIVLRPEGDPASEARVVLGAQHARCRADGRFELVLEEQTGAGDLLAFEPGYEPILRPALGASLAAGSTHELRLVLGPSTRSLTGAVLARDGRPLKGWTVELDGIDPLADFGLRERVSTDADGHFVFPDVPAGLHVVRAYAERRELALRSAPIAAGADGLVIFADPRE